MCKDKSKKFMLFLSKIGSALRFISIGKVNLGLYFKNRLQYSTIIGGLISLLFTIALFIYSLYVIIPIFNRVNFNTDYSVLRISEYDQVFEYTIRDLEIYNFILIELNQQNQSICEQVSLTINYTQDQGSQPETVGVFKFNDPYNTSDLLNNTFCLFQPNINQQYIEAIKVYKDKQAIYLAPQPYNFYMYTLTYVVSYQNLDEIIHIIVNYNSTEVSSTGITTDFGYNAIFFDGTNNLFNANFQLLEYQYSNSITGIAQDYDKSILVRNNPNIIQFQATEVKEKALVFYFQSTLSQYKQYPVSLISGLSKIGGLFGITKILTIAISIIHIKLFERSLRSQNNSPTSSKTSHKSINDSNNLSHHLIHQDDNSSLQTHEKQHKIEEVYSFTTFKRVLCQIDELEKRNDLMEMKLQQKDHEITRLKEDHEIQLLKLMDNQRQQDQRARDEVLRMVKDERTERNLERSDLIKAIRDVKQEVEGNIKQEYQEVIKQMQQQIKDLQEGIIKD